MFEDIGIVNFWTYMAGLILIILVPGPNSLYVLKSSTSYGTRAGYKAALGVFTGDAILIFLSFIGVASLIKASPFLFDLIRYLGAAYLLFLGGKILYFNLLCRTRPQDNSAIAVRTEDQFTKALMLSLTNPKAILFFMSFFIQFIDFSYPHTSLSYLVLALILELVSFTYLSTLIFGGYFIARYFRQQQGLAKVGNCAVGTFFMGFAAKLALFS